MSSDGTVAIEVVVALEFSLIDFLQEIFTQSKDVAQSSPETATK